ncbi:MAG: ABC transporter substrate-binding protein [Ruminococcus sp.]|jgi:NitT/TauT family transport system substrate-binding protein|nr:ABC transporter substrate-binding protein [Ruminococcus sp.]
MKRRIISVLIAATLTISALAGCSSAKGSESAKKTETGETSQSSASDSESGDDDTITIRSCFATGMTGAVNNFAIEKGLYKELGIEFDNIQWSSNDEVLSLITRGEIDVADGDPSAYIPGIYNGVSGKLVGNMWRYSGCYWLVANNDIKDISDLKGKTVGTAAAAGGMRLSVLKMLEENGLSEDDVTLVANGVYQSAYATLTSGEVDATIIHNPYAALAEADGVGHILGRAWDYIPDYYTGTIIASDDIIEKDPEKLQRFLTAYYKVHEEVKNERLDEFISWAATQMNTPEEVMKKAIESEIDVWFDYPVIPEDRISKTVEYLKDYGWLDKDVKAEGTYTNEFSQKAADELGLTNPESK